MNERIQALAIQAGDDWEHTLESDKQFLHKFAELIVRQCGEIAFQQWCDNGEHESAQSAILNHFGVK